VIVSKRSSPLEAYIVFISMMTIEIKATIVLLFLGGRPSMPSQNQFGKTNGRTFLLVKVME